MQNRYPVVSEVALDRAPRKVLGRSRSLSDLPKAAPGTELVFETSSGHIAFTDRIHLSGREDLVVNAVSVAVVDIRPRLVPVFLRIPSASPADDFTVQVDFACQVLSSERVAKVGLVDVATPLAVHLGQDTPLTQIAATRSVEEIAAVRSAVSARVHAYCKLRPPSVDGMEIRLTSVHVLTPSDLAAHAKQMRDLGWSQSVKDREVAAEDREIDRLARVYQSGPEYVASLATARGQANLAEAAEREYARADRRREELLRLLEKLPEGALDTVAIDVERVVAAAVSGIVGPDRRGPAHGRDDEKPERLLGGGQ
ncbi:hypothetical protein [Actinokineospora sp. NPDC004072]